jgi:tRNA(adenine34) deaminase
MSKQSEIDEHFMAMAIEEAGLSLVKGKLPVGAVVVFDGEVIAIGRKNGRSHAHLDHAERNACELVLMSMERENATGATVYTTLEPCAMCLWLMLHIRVSRIVYSLEDPYGGGICTLNSDSLPVRNKLYLPKITSGVLRDRSLPLFKDFFENTNSTFWQNKKNPLVKLCLGE